MLVKAILIVVFVIPIVALTVFGIASAIVISNMEAEEAKNG